MPVVSLGRHLVLALPSTGWLRHTSTQEQNCCRSVTGARQLLLHSMDMQQVHSANRFRELTPLWSYWVGHSGRRGKVELW
jgi:hypothetical protein